MKYSSLTQRIGGDSADAWQILYEAMDRQKAGDDVIILAVGDPDFDTPQPIINAAIDAVQNGATHYTDVVGDSELRTIIADWHIKTTGQSVESNQVVVMNGAQSALYGTAQVIMDAGDEVIIADPMYTTYEALFNATGSTVVKVPASPDNGFKVKAEDIEAAITDKTKAILLNSPNNPTGAMLPKSTMQAVADLCIKHDIWLISDEVYSTVTFGEQHFSPCVLPGMAERTITINSLSKSHAMTGWRVGWVVCPPEMAAHLGNLTLCMLFGSPQFIQEAAKVALTTDMPELNDMVQTYKKRRDVFYEHLKDIEDIHVHLPEAGMFLMVDIRKTGLNSQEMAELLLNKFDVAALPGVAFGPSGEGHIRVSLAVPEEDLARASQRIAACMEYLNSQRSN